MADPAASPDPVPGGGALLFAWLGGAVFVASLACFVYYYAVRFSSGSGPGWLAPAAIDLALFTGFALHHSLFARTGLKQAVSRILPAPLERSLFVWIASLLFIVVLIAWRPVPGLLYSLPAPWSWLGYAAQLAGVALTAQGTAGIDALDLAGIRQVLNAQRHTPPRHVPLETRGVYGLVRHPLYFGWVLMVFGTPHMTGTHLTFAAISTAYLALAIPFEERSLIAIFGDDYRAYQRHTRWRMLPGVW